MAQIQMTNFGDTTIASGISAGDTTITLAAGTGARFPALSAGDWFYAILVDTSANREIVKVTARSTDTLTATRAQEGTTARSFAVGSVLSLRLTVQAFQDYVNALSPITVATQTHGATGKATPVDADELPLIDSAASWGIKKLTWANLKATLKTYFDTLYATVAGTVLTTGDQTIAGVKTFSSQPIVPAQSMVRLNTANGYGSTNTKIRRFTNVVTNQGTDITYADSATLGGSFTINTAGVYAVTYVGHFNTTAWFGISLNASSPTTNIYSLPATEIVALAVSMGASNSTVTSNVLYLSAGSVIRAHTAGDGPGAGVEFFTVTRVS